MDNLKKEIYEMIVEFTTSFDAADRLSEKISELVIEKFTSTNTASAPCQTSTNNDKIIKLIEMKIETAERAVERFKNHTHAGKSGTDGSLQFRAQCHVEVLKELLTEIRRILK